MRAEIRIAVNGRRAPCSRCATSRSAPAGRRSPAGSRSGDWCSAPWSEAVRGQRRSAIVFSIMHALAMERRRRAAAPATPESSHSALGCQILSRVRTLVRNLPRPSDSRAVYDASRSGADPKTRRWCLLRRFPSRDRWARRETVRRGADGRLGRGPRCRGTAAHSSRRTPCRRAPAGYERRSSRRPS